MSSEREDDQHLDPDEYLEEKIRQASAHWAHQDPDEYLDMVRGRCHGGEAQQDGSSNYQQLPPRWHPYYLVWVFVGLVVGMSLLLAGLLLGFWEG